MRRSRATVTCVAPAAVKAVVDGEMVDEFVGALPESQVRAFIERLLPSPSAQAVRRARELMAEGVPEETARLQCWFVDSQGLVVHAREKLAAHKLPFAHHHAPLPDLAAAVAALDPTALVGVAAQQGAFTEEILGRMATNHVRPIIFALSNPTSRAECTAEEAYRWTDGRAIFASGSPWPAVEYGGRRIEPRQANNVYIFPGLGLAAVATQAREITEDLFLVAARALSDTVTEADLEQGSLFPPVDDIRRTSVRVAAAVARAISDAGLAEVAIPSDVEAWLELRLYDPTYD